jgi:murein DD-endopeptidase MepM/ murein hydrolase activator NlpD
MNIILLSKTRKSPININLRRGTVLALFFFFSIGLPAFFASIGYGVALLRVQPFSHDLTARLAVISQKDKLPGDAKANLTALTVRLGELQARAIRIDALGKRLVEISDLDKGEFDFDRPPGVGGPEGSTVADIDMRDFERAIGNLAHQLEDREQKLVLLETMLRDQDIFEETVPRGQPIEHGWISSHFGTRTDPFTGKRALHFGVDFAGKEGSKIVAVASGVVTWSGERFGYGRMVEVDHGNGYVTRYAHNSMNFVKVGDVIQKGEHLALMGSSGRSTGPHVHFEVLRDGTAVDPIAYVRAGR